MDDVLNGSYLRTGGIWAELNRRKSFARFAAIKDALSQHLTRTLYQQSRADVLQLIARKISYKEHLLRQFDEHFTDALHKQICSVESDINTFLGFVQAFDQMADLLTNETAHFVDHWYKTDRQLLRINQLLDAQTEMATMWSDTAFALHDHILTLPKPLTHDQTGNRHQYAY